MKFNNQGKPLVVTRDPKVGDVFPSKATGPKSYRNGTRYWMIIAITNGSGCNRNSLVHHMVGLDENGDIVSTTTYGDHVMKERPRVGHCKDLASLNLNIEWEPHTL